MYARYKRGRVASDDAKPSPLGYSGRPENESEERGGERALHHQVRPSIVHRSACLRVIGAVLLTSYKQKQTRDTRVFLPFSMRADLDDF